MSFNVFVAARRLLARELSWLGPIVKEVIEEQYIPELQEKAEKADGAKRDAYGTLIEEYREYADPRNPKYGVFDKQADIVMSDTARSFKFDEFAKDDMVQSLAVKFITDPAFKRVFDGFNVENGPKSLAGLMNRVIRLRSKNIVRDELRHNPMFHQVKKERDDEDEGHSDREDFDQPAAVGESTNDEEGLLQNERMALRDMQDDMVRYMRQNLKSDSAKVIFTSWVNHATERGPSNVKMGQVFDDALRMMGDMNMEPIKQAMLYRLWTHVKVEMANFFERELKVKLTPSMKQKLKIAGDLAVAYVSFRRKIAAWVLGRM